MKKTYALFILLGLNMACYANQEYKVEKVLHNGDYIINGLHWKPQANCAALRKGDKIKFFNKANGKCVSTTVMLGNSKSTCNLWCEDPRSDG
ncbi:MAG TPA: hypothetical protein PLD88_01825 [Candidatus Berkiella sp.]|nr:hypothetical protein [Candidatus Berkiella sp.]